MGREGYTGFRSLAESLALTRRRAEPGRPRSGPQGVWPGASRSPPAGPRAPTPHGEAVVVPAGELALLRMQENSPPLEPLLKDPAAFRLAFRDEDGPPALFRLDQTVVGDTRSSIPRPTNQRKRRSNRLHGLIPPRIQRDSADGHSGGRHPSLLHCDHRCDGQEGESVGRAVPHLAIILSAGNRWRQDDRGRKLARRKRLLHPRHVLGRSQPLAGC